MTSKVLEAAVATRARPAQADVITQANGATPVGLVIAVLAGLSAAWVAAGSVGLLALPVRHALDWCLLGTALAATLPQKFCAKKTIILLIAAAIAVAMVSSAWPVINILAAAVLLGSIAVIHDPRERDVLHVAAKSIVVFAGWRLALTSVPTLWLIADSIGRALGQAGGMLVGTPLWVGTTYGGLDYLVLMGALATLWMMRTPAPRGLRLISFVLAILLAQFIYLMVLSRLPQLLALLPPPGQPNPAIPFQQDFKNWADMVRDFVPWNAPVLCAILQLVVAGLMLRWSPLRDVVSKRPITAAAQTRGYVASVACIVLAALVPALAIVGFGPGKLNKQKIVLYEKGFLNWLRAEHGQYGRLSIGMYGMLPAFIQSLDGKALISPELTDEDLRDAQVLVILYPNRAWSDWQESPGQIKRIWDFVQRGGSLLIFSDHTIREADGRNRANDLLNPRQYAKSRRAELADFLEICQQHHAEIQAGVPISGSLPIAPEDYTDDQPKVYDTKPARLAYDLAREKQAREEYDRLGELESLPNSDMRVRFDAADFTVGGWLQSYEALSHPTNVGIHDDRNQFGVVIGASMDIHWPARPLLVGRWGWIDEGDAGSAAAMLGNHKYDPGEKLGDMVLSAEERIGKGRIIAFSDTSSITNGITTGAHDYVGRLLTYLSSEPASPQVPWRQFVGVVSVIGLLFLITRGEESWRTALSAAVMGCSLAICIMWTYRAAEALPDGRKVTPQRPQVQTDPATGRSQVPRQQWAPAADPAGRSYLMYVDSSHLPRSSEESWRPDGTMGLCMAFMRDNYLTLQLPELTEERLSKAAFYICIAPSRQFTSSERQIIRDYVEKGGVFIITAGWDARGVTQEVLDDYGMYIGIAPPGSANPVPPPEPLGFFKAPYYTGTDFQCFVRFHAAWPVGPNPAVTPVTGLQAIATGRLGTADVPVILMKSVGKGKIVLVGDTCFAMNKNLETEGGELFDQMRENIDFWRWFIPYLSGETPWLPAKPVPLDPATGQPLPPATQPATQPTEPVEAPMTQPAGPPLPPELTVPPTTQPETQPATQPAIQPTARAFLNRLNQANAQILVGYEPYKNRTNSSLSLVPGGEGRGEGQIAGLSKYCQLSSVAPPLTLTLSPEYEGEGTRLSSHVAPSFAKAVLL